MSFVCDLLVGGPSFCVFFLHLWDMVCSRHFVLEDWTAWRGTVGHTSIIYCMAILNMLCRLSPSASNIVA